MGSRPSVEGYVVAIVAVVTTGVVVRIGKAEVGAGKLKRATVEHLANVVRLGSGVAKKTAKQEWSLLDVGDLECVLHLLCIVSGGTAAAIFPSHESHVDSMADQRRRPARPVSEPTRLHVS